MRLSIDDVQAMSDQQIADAVRSQIFDKKQKK